MLAATAASLNDGRSPTPGCTGARVNGPLATTGTPVRFARNAEIYGEDEPAECFYQVFSGVVRTCKLLDDGRRQIGAFYLPGDIFGIEAGDVYLASAEAVSDACVLVAKRNYVLARADHDKDLARQLWILAVQELRRVQQHTLLLVKSAEERVAGFLLDMASRHASGSAIELMMSRQDIADHLGLTIETVSRTFTQFAQSGAIVLHSARRVELRDRAALLRLNA